ncbi:orotidine-5'-phosphate decarboxylase [Pelagibius sp. Alg239-R121]|uniref:orotidine-5'-phosphate decarboxylase n=1 Tax=Pelagibius sp. Alg239-R121 TaxID=2993448 RepID=UPI0024A61EEE|nr:orotidine-5'-phosphate decarboxylase [Pelagibius sp. Alg239-R121]
MDPKERILVGIDTPDLTRAESLVRSVAGRVGGIKIGKEFFTAQGPEAVRKLVGDDSLFLDLKFHDIPNTVAGAVRSSLRMKPQILNVHASGGRAMMTAAAQAAQEEAAALAVPKPLVIAVTVLTSLDDEDLVAVGQQGPASAQVERLAALTQDCGLDGVVCSPREIAVLRAACGPDFKLIVPGIRPTWSVAGDQKRIMTPSEAVSIGADYIVIGRPITSAEDPAEAADRIAMELAGH